MDKRVTKRIKTHQLARVCGKMGVVNNMSDTGMQIATAVLPKTRKVDVSFEALGQEISIVGMVQWFRRKNSLQNLNQLGVVLSETPQTYRRLVTNLNDAEAAHLNRA